MTNNKDISKNQYLIFNDNTIIEIDNGIFSFITLIPLKSVPEKDWKETEESSDKNYLENIINPLINSLSPFDPPKFIRRGDLGTTYKVISLYEENTVLQESLIKDISNYDRIRSVGKDVYDEADDYLAIKQAQKAETIANFDHYEKSDFLVTKTMIYLSDLVKSKEVVSESGDVTKIECLDIDEKELPTHFENYTQEKWEKDRRVIESLFIGHNNTYKEISSNLENYSIKIRSSNIIQWFSRLSLSTYKTDVIDLNCFKNSVLNYSKKHGRHSVQIKTGGGEAPIRVVDYHPEKVVVLNVPKNQTITYKVNTGEEIEVLPPKDSDHSVLISKVSYHNGIPRKRVLESIEKTSNMVVEEVTPDSTSRSFFLTKMPMGNIKDFSLKLAKKTLDALSPESFVQQVEIFMLPPSEQEKNYTDQIRSKEFFNGVFGWMNPGNRLIFKKQDVLDQIEALTVAKSKVGDENLVSIRYSFGYKKRVDLDKDVVSLRAQMKSLGVEEQGYVESIQTLDRIFLPWTFNPFILDKNARQTAILASEGQFAEMVNLKHGQRDLSFARPKEAVDVDPIRNSCFFVKSDTEVMGVDIFKGPEKFNGLIIAPSGSGKSFFAVNMLDGFVSSNPNNTTWILDRGGSFKRFTSTYGGINKELTQATKKNSINPFGLNLSMMLMVKLHFYENYLNATEIKDGFSVKKNKLTKEINSEIQMTIILLKIISTNTTSSFFLVDDDDTMLEYERMGLDSRKKLDIFRYIVKDGELIEIGSEFFVTQIQDTFAVMSSIVLSMLGIKNKSESIATAFKSFTPKVLNDLFLNKMEAELKDKSFIFNYNPSSGEVLDERNVECMMGSKWDEVKKNVAYPAEKSTSVKFKTEDEIIDYGSTSVYFIIEELKYAFEAFIHCEQDLPNKEEILLTLKELDFYIDELEAGKLFNVEPPKDLSSESLVNIDLGESQDVRLTTVVPSALLMNFFKVLTSPSKKGGNKILVIDEAHAILGAPDIAGLRAIAYLFRTTRKHGGAVWLISQSIEDFYKPGSDRQTKLDALVKNAGWRVLLGSKHGLAREALGFTGDSVAFSEKTKENKEKYKVVIDMDGKVTNVVDLVVSASDYWMSTTHAAEVAVLDVLALVLGSPKRATLMASRLFSDSSSGMRGTYSTILSLQEANPAPSPEEVIREVQLTTGLNYTELQIQRILKDYKIIYSLMREADKVSLQIK